jgi:glucokinase
VILVNGLPGAGKTTLARVLSRRLRLPLFSKDVIKEAHADVVGSEAPDSRPQRRWNSTLGAAAGETMWALLADAPCGAVLESCWPAGVRHFVVAGLGRAGVEHPLEIWCDVPPGTARARFRLRHPQRHPIHGTVPDDEEWEQRWGSTGPLEISDVLRVDTTRPVDFEHIVHWVEAGGGCARPFRTGAAPECCPALPGPPRPAPFRPADRP